MQCQRKTGTTCCPTIKANITTRDRAPSTFPEFFKKNLYMCITDFDKQLFGSKVYLLTF